MKDWDREVDFREVASSVRTQELAEFLKFYTYSSSPLNEVQLKAVKQHWSQKKS
jgi:hypothetical protein